MTRLPLPLLAALALPALILSGRALAADDGMCTQPSYGADGVPTLQPPPPPTVGGNGLDQTIFVDADQANMTQQGISQLTGAVRVRQGAKAFAAENLDFDNEQQLITVNTESVFTDPNLVIKSEQASYNLNDNSGVFTKSHYVLPGRDARGRSDRIAVQQGGTAQLQNTTYTTCPPGSKAWSLLASEINLDQDEGLGTARNARLRLGGVPVLYAPWFQFPIDDRRRTGLLFPTVGNSSQSGYDARWPVYLNLAPNYDAMVTPRYMSERGLQLGASGRYLLANGEGRLTYEYLDDDKLDQSRSLTRFDHAGLLGKNLGLEATYARVSDSQYFEDLGSTLASSSITYLEQSARLTYQAPASWRLQGLVQTFQTIDTGIQAVDDPYKRLPQITFTSLTRNPWYDTRAGFNTEFVNFARDSQSVQGQRVDVQPFLRFQHDENAWYVTSQAEYHYTQYRLTDTEFSTDANQPDDPSRSLPVLSGEAGLRFERNTGSGEIQTLEPRLFALYVPYTNQDDLPIFDTGEPAFDFTQLFATNRFFGQDRIADARNLTAAITTRTIDPETGDTRWSASLGQLYRFEDSRVTLPTQDEPDAGLTDLIGEFSYSFVQYWSAVATGQWSPDRTRMERSNVGLRYRRPHDGSRFDVAYRERRDILEQVDASFDLPVTTAWRLGARGRYSLRDDKTLETFVGASYSTCCWGVSAAYRRYIATSEGNLVDGIYFQLELKGLSQIGTGFSQLLPSDDGDEETTPGALGETADGTNRQGTNRAR